MTSYETKLAKNLAQLAILGFVLGAISMFFIALSIVSSPVFLQVFMLSLGLVLTLVISPILVTFEIQRILYDLRKGL